jgi:hypothetical protein
MIIQHTVTRRRDEYTYFFCRNRQQGTCLGPYVNVAIAEQVVDAIATLTTGGSDSGRTLGPVQIYQSCTNDQRQLLNRALFHRLYLADDRITNHEPRPTAP